MKMCKECEIEKELEEFHNKTMGKFGKDSICIPCRKEKSQKKYLENKETIKQKTREYKQQNKEKVAERGRRYDKEHAEEISLRKAKYRDENAEKISAQKKEYHSREEVKARRNEWHRTKLKTDMQYKLKSRLRSRIACFFKNNGRKAGSAVKDLGCSIDEFLKYIESKFTEDMTWDNYGEWHVDHIIPLSKFDLTDREQFCRAAHFSNLQPLWAEDNFKKNRFLK